MGKLKIECQFCKKEIVNPKEFEGETIQRFCSKKCRYDFHNRRKLEPFTKELTALLKKYGYGESKDGR